tara:strand:+ start:2120 stop:2266 length:147 start_codon:yes stop_codon:yes gene_type:complete
MSFWKWKPDGKRKKMPDFEQKKKLFGEGWRKRERERGRRRRRLPREML